MRADQVNENTVLVVEDNAMQRLFAQKLLEKEGFDVVLARDGQMGVQLAQQLCPALILLDVELPKMNGFQVCMQLKCTRATRCIPIILWTCHEESELVELGLQAGAIDFIPKDAFGSTVLLETLQQIGLLGRAQAVQ